LPLPLKSRSTSVTPWKAGWLPSIPVSSTATTTPLPSKPERSAPMAVTPHAVFIISVGGTSSGWTSLVGITGAMAVTSGSRLRS
jgi:hypothetical protein